MNVQVDENTRASMWKLRQTWNDVFPAKKLFSLDVRVQSIDPAWPITAPPTSVSSGSIHVNPRFFSMVSLINFMIDIILNIKKYIYKIKDIYIFITSSLNNQQHLLSHNQL